MSAHEQYQVIQYKGAVGWLCRRCTTVNFTVDDTDMTQGVLTLAELDDTADEHEHRVHNTITAVMDTSGDPQ